MCTYNTVPYPSPPVKVRVSVFSRPSGGTVLLVQPPELRARRTAGRVVGGAGGGEGLHRCGSREEEEAEDVRRAGVQRLSTDGDRATSRQNPWGGEPGLSRPDGRSESFPRPRAGPGPSGVIRTASTGVGVTCVTPDDTVPIMGNRNSSGPPSAKPTPEGDASSGMSRVPPRRLPLRHTDCGQHTCGGAVVATGLAQAAAVAVVVFVVPPKDPFSVVNSRHSRFHPVPLFSAPLLRTRVPDPHETRKTQDFRDIDDRVWRCLSEELHRVGNTPQFGIEFRLTTHV